MKTMDRPPARAAKKAATAAGAVLWGGPAGAKGARKPPTTGELVELVRAGLPTAELEALRARLDLPMERLAPKLGLSRATLHRRKHEGRLAPDESDKLLRFARLFTRAVEVFTNEAEARRWLQAPQMGLGGAVPLDFAESEIGAREVEDLLGRIDHGVYS